MARNSKSRSGDATRLDANAWTEAALEALATNGIDGVRVAKDMMARRENVLLGGE